MLASTSVFNFYHSQAVSSRGTKPGVQQEKRAKKLAGNLCYNKEDVIDR